MATAKVIYEGDLRTNCTHVQSGDEIITDAPTDNHGKGMAFSPTDLLSTSLVTCMLTTMGIKAAIQGIPFGRAEAEMQKIMSADPRRVSQIIITIRMPQENYTEEQKRTLEDIALNCPVAKSLDTEVTQQVDFQY